MILVVHQAETDVLNRLQPMYELFTTVRSVAQSRMTYPHGAMPNVLSSHVPASPLVDSTGNDFELGFTVAPAAGPAGMTLSENELMC